MHAARAGVLQSAIKQSSHPAKNHADQAPPDDFVIHTGEALSRALETREWGRPVALGEVMVC